MSKNGGVQVPSGARILTAIGNIADGPSDSAGSRGGTCVVILSPRFIGVCTSTKLTNGYLECSHTRPELTIVIKKLQHERTFIVIIGVNGKFRIPIKEKVLVWRVKTKTSRSL